MIALRPAAATDISVLRHWNAKPHVVAASGSEDQLPDWESELAIIAGGVDWQEILIAELDGRPLGVITIIDPAREETHYWGPCESGLRAIDIWIGRPDFLNRGYGTTMMRQAITHCFTDPSVTALIVDPLADNERAIRFYQRLGFRPQEHHRFVGEEQPCLILRLDRSLSKHQTV